MNVLLLKRYASGQIYFHFWPCSFVPSISGDHRAVAPPESVGRTLYISRATVDRRPPLGNGVRKSELYRQYQFYEPRSVSITSSRAKLYNFTDRKNNMSTSGIAKHRTRAININSNVGITRRYKMNIRTMAWNQAHGWQQDNKYIRSGYRVATPSLSGILASLTFLHNETCNVYIHLAGAILLPLFAYFQMQLLSEYRPHDFGGTDYLMFGLFFGTAEICLIVSTLYHLNMSHSQPGEQFWLRMDLFGIIIVTAGTHISGINYVFVCEEHWKRLYWTIVGFPDDLFEPDVDWSISNMLTCITDYRFQSDHKRMHHGTHVPPPADR